jgi:uncharacterized membrane protein YtjA (UPF0391 family)
VGYKFAGHVDCSVLATSTHKPARRPKPRRHTRRKSTMLKLALFFAVVAVIAAVFGFTGVAAGAAAIAKILFLIFVVLCVIFLVIGFVVTKKIVD